MIRFSLARIKYFIVVSRLKMQNITISLSYIVDIATIKQDIQFSQIFI